MEKDITRTIWERATNIGKEQSQFTRNRKIDYTRGKSYGEILLDNIYKIVIQRKYRKPTTDNPIVI